MYLEFLKLLKSIVGFGQVSLLSLLSLIPFPSNTITIQPSHITSRVQHIPKPIFME